MSNVHKTGSKMALKIQFPCLFCNSVIKPGVWRHLVSCTTKTRTRSVFWGFRCWAAHKPCSPIHLPSAIRWKSNCIMKNGSPHRRGAPCEVMRRGGPVAKGQNHRSIKGFYQPDNSPLSELCSSPPACVLDSLVSDTFLQNVQLQQ